MNTLPGITGYLQLNKDKSGSIENLVFLDMYYYQHKSFLLDLKLIVSIIVIALSASHHDSILSPKEINYFAGIAKNEVAVNIMEN